MNFLHRFMTALRLRCPRCRKGQLFNGLLSMHQSCPRCGLTLEPEPGFYLGSVYANYAATTLIALVGFVVAVFGFGYSKNVVVWLCTAFTVIFPLWFFRYARSIWLSLMYSVSASDWSSAVDREQFSQSRNR